jgi:S-adenosylmethionine:tRNA ribosyltransferase-isomerase
VVRALESAARAPGVPGSRRVNDGHAAPTTGVTDLRLGPGTPLLVTGGLLTGIHDEGTSHFALLEAFCEAPLLRRAWAAAEAAGFLGHELGDAALVLR